MALTNEDLQAIGQLLDTKLDERLKPINDNLEKITSEVSALKAGQLSVRKELREVKHKVSDTYDLALEAWGQSTENRRWLENEKAI